MGGGVYKDFGVKALPSKGIPIKKSVMWAVGQSLCSGVDKLDVVTSLPYADWATRDVDAVESESRYLPCASCMHPMLDQPGGKETLLFLNADSKVIGDPSAHENLQFMARHRGWNLLFNNCSAAVFSDALACSGTVVTNSYHGAYWGLLSGRSVVLMGYSSKFRSLLLGFDISPTRMVPIEKGRADVLAEVLEDIDLSRSLCLGRAAEVRRNFRQCNIAFAERLVQQQLIQGFTLKTI
ncbi:MAG: hypothetical protein MUC65_09740 [Pontiellaceae bacterium]|nr:hypothetical protein [Pontiellaceae bacterium]